MFEKATELNKTVDQLEMDMIIAAAEQEVKIDEQIAKVENGQNL